MALTEPTKPAERTLPTAAIAIAAVAVLLLVGLFTLLGRKHTAVSDKNHAADISIANVVPAQADNVLGGTSTYVDGQFTDNGTANITGVILEATFHGQNGAPDQVETEQAQRIRTRDPIVDLQPFSAAPLTPGTTADFRLVFETVKEGWDQQAPTLRVIGVTTSR